MREACGFRDAKPAFDDLNTTLLGISRDDIESHRAFIAKHDLNIALLADVDGAVCETYDVWREWELDGEKRMGIQRSTFVIDAQGNLALILRQVDPVDHIAEVEAFIRQNLQN